MVRADHWASLRRRGWERALTLQLALGNAALRPTGRMVSFFLINWFPPRHQPHARRAGALCVALVFHLHNLCRMMMSLGWENEAQR